MTRKSTQHAPNRLIGSKASWWVIWAVKKFPIGDPLKKLL